MSDDNKTDEQIAELLRSVRTIAVIGASNSPDRPSYGVMEFLLAKGYEVHPINPGLAGKTLLGAKVYANLADVPAPIDMIDIFRNSQAAGDVIRAAIPMKDRLGLKAVWMQLGVRNDEAARAAELAGVTVVFNRCPKIEIARLNLK